jgi:hypothetical protein
MGFARRLRRLGITGRSAYRQPLRGLMGTNQDRCVRGTDNALWHKAYGGLARFGEGIA